MVKEGTMSRGMILTTIHLHPRPRHPPFLRLYVVVKMTGIVQVRLAKRCFSPLSSIFLILHFRMMMLMMMNDSVFLSLPNSQLETLLNHPRL